MEITMVKAVIFDFDGTLADTIPDLLTAINRLRAKYGLSEVDEKFVLKFVNLDTESFVRASVPEIGDNINEGIRIYKEEYSRCYLEKTKPFPGMEELVRDLRSKGIRLAIFSNKLNDYICGLAKKLYPDMFEIPLGVGAIASKPAPDGVFMILDKFGVSADETVFVGDSEIDFETAKNAGVRAVGVSWGYRGREFLEKLGMYAVVDTTNELNEIIMKI